jgi:hypothetical protein
MTDSSMPRLAICLYGDDNSEFFANSILFSRACEFYLNNIPLDALVEDSLEVRFFFHLKSYNIITECINYENRSLFKRTAPNS